jgi:hypothetical protein
MTGSRTAVILAALAVIGLAVPAAAQHRPHAPGGRQHEPQDMKAMMAGPWKELNDFHRLLHESHHPLMESGDLDPARHHAEDLALAAESWARSSPPAECPGAGLSEKVAALATESRAFAKLVAGEAADEQVKAALVAIRDRFAALHRACRPRQP